MALQALIGADITDLQKKIKEAEFNLKELSKKKIEDIKLGLDTKEIQGNIKSVKASLADLKTTLKDTGGSFDAMSPKVANGGNTLMQFSRIAQDAPFGIIGIGNNLTATAESFSYLSKSAGGTGNALKAVASSLLGTGGILLAVSLVTTGLTYLSQNGLTVSDVFKKLTGDFDGYAEALKKVNEAVYSDQGVQKAISNVNELKINIDLAKKGFIDKEQVVNQYNETIGKTTGLVSSLDEAEKEITKNGDAYIKMTLFKAAANLALEAAGKEALKAEQIRVKKLSEFTNAFLDADLTQTRSKEQYEAKQRNLQNQAKKRQQAEIKINEDAANANLSIAKKFQQQAAQIAKDFDFNIFGDTKAPKAKKKEFVGNTPQVSGVQSSLDPAGLVDLNKIAVTTGAIDKFGNKVKELPGIIRTSMGEVKLAFDTSNVYILEALAEFNKSASDIINGSISDTFYQLGANIGDALANGGNVLKSIGKTLLSSLGSVLMDLGKLAIQTGVGLLGVKLALKTLNPAAAIGAGVALVAIGSAFSSGASSLGGSSGRGGGGNRSVSTGSSVSSPTSSTGSSSSGFSGGTVVFEISGQSLVGVLSNTLDRNRRLGGALGLG